MDRKITNDEIAQKAYELYLKRGCQDGHDMEDWVRAEQELAQSEPKTKTVSSGVTKTKSASAKKSR